jgi:cobaltochelatase CobS
MFDSKAKIQCMIDGAETHSIRKHLADTHPDWTIERYQTTYPDAPLLSPYAMAVIEIAAKAKAEAAPIPELSAVKRPFHEVFDFGSMKEALSTRGTPIQIDVFEGLDLEHQAYLQVIDENYVFPVEETKDVLIGWTINKPVYIWGFHGTGKTTLLEQVSARTKRPFLRVQHTVNTEESQIVGQYVYRNKETRWQPGPLQEAMRLGLVYCADEYDRGVPNVLSVYQPVLEGKSLIIKEAPPEFRVTAPHRDFRFVATGNTNGCGDETGLYQGTLMQDAANYSRFGLTIELGYMPAPMEIKVVCNQAKIREADAGKLRSFAEEVRTAYANGKIGSTISPRELINAASIARVRGSDWRGGLKRAWSNRLSRIDREVVDKFSQRIFG